MGEAGYLDNAVALRHLKLVIALLEQLSVADPLFMQFCTNQGSCAGTPASP